MFALRGFLVGSVARAVQEKLPYFGETLTSGIIKTLSKYIRRKIIKLYLSQSSVEQLKNNMGGSLTDVTRERSAFWEIND